MDGNELAKPSIEVVDCFRVVNGRIIVGISVDLLPDRLEDKRESAAKDFAKGWTLVAVGADGGQHFGAHRNAMMHRKRVTLRLNPR